MENDQNSRQQKVKIERIEKEIPEIIYDLHEGESMDFIYYDEAAKKFQINPEVAEIIFDQGGTAGFIFNIGEENIGKTFLLNNALDLDMKSNYFTEEEKGIKIWTKPFYKLE